MKDNATQADRLLACLQQNPAPTHQADLAQCNTADFSSIVELARQQLISPYLYYRLTHNRLDQLFPASILQQLQSDYYSNAVRNLQYFHDLAKVTAALTAHNIPIIILKGAHLASTIYQNPGLRKMVDLDLLVPRSLLARSADVLIELGYQPFGGMVDAETYTTTQLHLPRFIKADTAGIEIHWTITHPGRAYALVIDDLWQRAIPVTLAGQNDLGQNVLGLCPEDLLLHLCVHASYQHLFTLGLRNLLDLDECLQRFAGQLDWQAIVQRAQQWHCQRGVHLILALAAKLLHTPIPSSLLQQLQPNGFRQALLEEAQAMLFSNWNPQRRVSLPFTQMMDAPRLIDKIPSLWQSIFLPRQQIASLYAISPTSLRLTWGYLLRCRDLLARYQNKMPDWLHGETTLTQPARRLHRLAKWLERA